MSLAPVAKTVNEENYWLVSNPSALGDIAGFRAPDRVSAFVSESATDDGEVFDYAPFEGGKIDAVLCVLTEEEADTLFTSISAAFSRRQFAADMLEAGNEGLVATWNLPDGRVALLASDLGGSSLVQDMWYASCRFAKIPPFEEGRVYDSSHFSADKLREKGSSAMVSVADSLAFAPTKARPRLG